MTSPFLGAIPDDTGVRFRVMAPGRSGLPRRAVDLVLYDGRAAGTHPLQPSGDGVFETYVYGAAAGDRYAYRLDGGDPRPDPASRFQPDGVHQPSEVIDPSAFAWTDTAWTGHGPGESIVYELHIGAFTPEGTFDAARQRLPELQRLGVTLVEIMPVADFPGARNWGYDGVCLFAPSRAYGRPDDFRAFVDEAHRRGIGVLLDVVYNHLGPEGAYLPEFHPCYITDRHSTPWGGAINLDGCGSGLVRRFIVDNAMHWIREYHLDGLRLDATHALIDASPVHIAAELSEHIRTIATRPMTVHAEDHRNLAALVQPREAGGWGLDGVWADDFHHVVRRLVAGDAHGYYRDYEGTADELARTIRQGWLYTGQPSKHLEEPRGTDASVVPMRASVICLQNHDQVGNRAIGDRLHHAIDPAAWRAASVVLLTAPATPLLFMGQEWSASTPFAFFTDLEPELGRAVTEGRRREFQDFPEFADEAARERIPDPQAPCTFVSSKLQWAERDEPPHASTLALYTALIALRRGHRALQASECCTGEAWAFGAGGLVMRRSHSRDRFLIVAALARPCEIDFGPHLADGASFDVVLTTEDAQYAPEPQPAAIAGTRIRFSRPGAVILRAVR
jgi:maltooligosyltrehalose trehalohydrolase